jgi:hypothetical protein
MGRGEAELREAIRRWREWKGQRSRVDGVNSAPACLYGLLVQDALDDVQADLLDVNAELVWVRKLIVAAIVTAAVGTLLRLAGLQ